MKDIHDIIQGPILTEKSYDQIPFKKYSFSVALDATKPEIKYAVEQIFGVKVDSVNTLRKKGRLKKQGRTQGFTARSKKAIVTLKPESKAIEFFESMIQ